jgi:hypothetical protein
MAIFRPDKSGDVMGKEVRGRLTVKQKMAYREQKVMEEEKEVAESYYRLKRESSKFKEAVDRGLRDAGVK